MAIPNDPTFGSDFDAKAFRDAITSTMLMGMPSDSEEQASFIFTNKKSFDVADAAGRPYDWSDAPSASSPPERAPVTIPVAVEFISRASLADGTPIGDFDTPKLIVTVIDEYFPQVKGASHIKIDNTTYKISYLAPPIGLFSVTIYQFYCAAVDEV